MRQTESLYSVEMLSHEKKLSSVLHKLDVYSIMIDGVADCVDTIEESFSDENFASFRSAQISRDEMLFQEIPQVFSPEVEAKYLSAKKVLDSLVHTPALFESLSEEVRTKYAHHDLFQDFYNKVTSRATLLDQKFKDFSEEKWLFYESQTRFLKSGKTEDDIESFLKIRERFFDMIDEFEEDIIFFRRMKELWPYYKLIMEALVVRSFNIESGHRDEYFVPERIGSEHVQKDCLVSDVCEHIENFLKVYPKSVYLEDVSVFFDPALFRQKIHISEGVLFNIIRNIIGNIISPEKQKKISAHNLLIGFSSAVDPTGIPFLRITISDDGRGISEEMIPVLFKEGVSGTESTGLGLAHIDEFIYSMHGHITVESRIQEKETPDSKRFSFQAMKAKNIREFLEKKDTMNTTFSLHFPLVQK